MTENEFNAFCKGLPATTYVNQWGGAHVWKVGGKVFVIARFAEGAHPTFSFKVSDLAFEILGGQPGLRPAPYLASRGLKWIQFYEKPGLSAADLKDYLRQSHRLVAAGLSKKKRLELGIGEAETAPAKKPAKKATAPKRARRYTGKSDAQAKKSPGR